MIKIVGYEKSYGSVRALDGLSLEVESGAVYGFLGPNGAGKTTTMRLLSGLAQPDKGQAWIMGKLAGKETRRHIGVLPEEPAFYPWMTPREYLRDFTAALFQMDRKTASQRAEEMLELTDLKSVANRRIGGFSRGMRQRLGVAQALIHQPAVLLMDEPVSALDPAGRKEVLDLIEKLRGSTTIILSTHILADVERVCDVIGIINKGKLVLQEKSEALMNRYAQPIIEVEIEKGLETWVEAVKPLEVINKMVINHSKVRLLVSDIQSARRQLLSSLATHEVVVNRFELIRPSLEDIFLQLTEN